jgi:hypothetical protein
MKLKFHVPTQQYGFLEIDGTEKDVEKMEKLYNKYAETPLLFSNGVFEKVKTFTNEIILYNKDAHVYTDLKGNKLISASVFKKQFDKAPFDKTVILPKMKEKYGVEEHVIDEIWSFSGSLSASFGKVIHASMEQYFKYKEYCDKIDNQIEGEKKEYHIPKHPFLNNMVKSFPLLGERIIPEIMVSCLAKKMAGQVDGLVVTGKNEGYIIDYKSDRDIQKNLKLHFIQMSFYAYILQQFGWKISKVEVWNYTDEWKGYESEVIDIITLKK